ncbi:hypothetical protein ACO0SA_002978 [Hanseniaspora valbyensis]
MNKQRTLDFFSTKKRKLENSDSSVTTITTTTDKNTNVTENELFKKNSETNSISTLLQKKTTTPTLQTVTSVVKKTIDLKIHDINIPFLKLAQLCQSLEETAPRLEKLTQLEEFFDEVIAQDTSQLEIVTNFLLNQLGPDYIQDLELGFGEHLILKILHESFGYKLASLKTKLKEIGDLGQLTFKLRSEMRSVFTFKSNKIETGLSLSESWKLLNEIAASNSHKEKINKIRPNLSKMTPVECKFFIRFLEGRLRIGSSQQSIITALSRSFLKYDKQNGRSLELDALDADRILRKVYVQVPNYAIVIDNFLKEGLEDLETNLTLEPGIPLKPMLAKPCKSAIEALAEFENEVSGKTDMFVCEYKYDGERIQFHQVDDGSIKIFSRNSEDMTQKYPELTEFSQFYNKDANVNNLIIDGEVVAYDLEEDKILPFQVLTTRKRKNVDIKDIKVQVCIYVFDILCLNGQSLLDKTLEERRNIYMDIFVTTKGKLQFASNIITNDELEISKFLDQAIQDKCEGLMVKALTGAKSTYEPASRSKHWMKLKKDYLQGVGDSLDLVIMGAYFGKGKRTGNYGGFLLGSYNVDNDELETCCKIGTGFTDEDLATLFKTLKEYESEVPPSNYIFDSQTKPDVWFSQPKLLLEVLCADLSLSPVYKSAIDLVGSDRGISLRFPRMIRIRDDKSYTMATSSEQVLEMYQSQSNLQ